MRKKCGWLFMLCLWTSLVGRAGVAERLVKEGFENVRVCYIDGTLYTAVENDNYRGTWRGLGVALQTMGSEAVADTLMLVALENKMPRLRVVAVRTGNAGGWQVKVDYETENVMKILKREAPLNSSTWKTDIVLYPQVALDNHQFYHLFNAAVDLAPAVEMGLWRGADLKAQVVFPIWNNYASEHDYVRPGVVRLRQELLSTSLWQASASVGVFNEHRAGLHAEVYRHFGSRLDVGLLAGYTGVWYMDGSKPVWGNLNKVNLLAHVSYYEPWSSLQVELTGGRFVYGDYGVRGDCTRHFGEYAVGVYATLSGGDHNAGFHFAIPFGPKRSKRKGAVRLRLPEYFDWEYSMVSYFDFVDKHRATLYEVEPDRNRSARYWQPAYVEVYLQKFLNGMID